MTLDTLRDRLPDYAKDLRINLGIITSATALSPQQAWGTAIAAAVTARSPDVLAAITASAGNWSRRRAASAARWCVRTSLSAR